jgi:hypothetical protein
MWLVPYVQIVRSELAQRMGCRLDNNSNLEQILLSTKRLVSQQLDVNMLDFDYNCDVIVAYSIFDACVGGSAVAALRCWCQGSGNENIMPLRRQGWPIIQYSG